MAKNRNTRVVLVSARQFEHLERLQKQERERSPVGAAPSVHALARGLLDKSLNTLDSVSDSKGIGAGAI